MFPFVAVLVLFSGFMLDEVLGLGGSAAVNAVYSAGNYLYLFIFLPLTFVDGLTLPIIMKSALILTLVWWYILSCVVVFFGLKPRANQI